MKKKYTTPKATAIECQQPVLCAGSTDDSDDRHTCNRYCKWWHRCMDRSEGKICFDKMKKY